VSEKVDDWMKTEVAADRIHLEDEVVAADNPWPEGDTIVEEP